MLRDKSLVPLSHQHHDALFLCVRIERAHAAADFDPGVWQAEIQHKFEESICGHFEAEEKILFPEAARFPELQSLIRDLLRDHDTLRGYFSRAVAKTLDADTLLSFADKLSTHIRKEERELFERCQQLMPPEQLSRLGAALEDALKHIPTSCAVASPATRLRPRNKN
jgi:iron-sulfur cluster repair protein YtfE (RIC family)